MTEPPTPHEEPPSAPGSPHDPTPPPGGTTAPPPGGTAPPPPGDTAPPPGDTAPPPPGDTAPGAVPRPGEAPGAAPPSSGYGPPSGAVPGYGPPPGAVPPGAVPPPGGYGPQPGPPPPGYASHEDRTWVLVAHFGGAAGMLVLGGIGGWIAPLIALGTQGGRSPAVRAHSLAALNFQLLLSIVGLVGWITACIWVGWVFVGAAWLLGIIFGVLAGITANDGKFYQYPFRGFQPIK